MKVPILLERWLRDIRYFKKGAHIGSRCTAMRDWVWAYNLSVLFNTMLSGKFAGRGLNPDYYLQRNNLFPTPRMTNCRRGDISLISLPA
ncbi:hypothetical protein [Pseudomonas sp. R5(2019)]|uniref:hypothetical protein n=1 Tax=Pseudomonas sp. R5(2019) TaxID=2697566 RepID=UPI0014132BEC|nr:hypothetical protein [Pseudomonas sp. R5(2019)]NBA97516.1 hypothetical protein [Pseudomonas sp. R5(2019)]